MSEKLVKQMQERNIEVVWLWSGDSVFNIIAVASSETIGDYY